MIQEAPDPVIESIPMVLEAFEALIGIESEYRYEWIDGRVYCMASPEPEHNAIVYNIEGLFKQQLGKRGPCRTHHEITVLIPNQPSSTPDIVLTCDPADIDKDKRLKPFKVRSPRVIIEVLSPSTRAFDRGEKFERYRHCSTLEVYMLVEQNEPCVKVFRLQNDWQEERYTGEQVIQLEQPALQLPLSEIYDGIF